MFESFQLNKSAISVAKISLKHARGMLCMPIWQTVQRNYNSILSYFMTTTSIKTLCSWNV